MTEDRITGEVEHLTAPDANRLLDKNTHNRPLKQGDILKWATEMEAGNWQMNGEPIKIAHDGTILDGQHRLHALRLQEDDLKVPFYVIRGLDPETQKTMDQGRRRTASDQLNLSGIEVDGRATAAIRFYMAYDQGLMFTDRKARDAIVTTPSMVDWAAEHRREVELLAAGVGFIRSIKTRSGVLGTAYALVALEHGTDVADEFFTRVGDGVDQSEGSPILAMRARLDQVRGQGQRTDRAMKVSDRDLLGMFIVAFNAWVMGKKLGRLQRPNGGTWEADNYPEVITQRGLRISRTMREVRASGGN